MFWLDKDEKERLSQIVHVLFEHHFGYFLTGLRLRKKLPFRKRIKTEHFEKKTFSPKDAREIIEALDGSFIKLGQLLSLRPDLIPTEYCTELAKLQDSVRAFPGEEAILIIESELKKPLKKIFKEFNPVPVAAASMGQVHRAVLLDGTVVAVKVQRPNIQKTVKTDIKLLYRLATIVSKRFKDLNIDFIGIVREFERYTENEVNYLKEAHSIDIFSRNLASSKDMAVPTLFWEYTSSRVITSTFMAGKPLSDITHIPAAKKRAVVNKILNSELEQIFIYGFFHADPHPGNFILMRNGKIALLDFGIVGRLDDELKEFISDLYLGMMNADVNQMVDAALRLGAVTKESDMSSLREDIADHFSTYYNVNVEKVNMSDLLNRIINVFKKHELRIPPNFVLLAKATLTLESLTSRYDPKFNIVERSKPFVKKLMRQRTDPKYVASRAKRKIAAMFRFAESLPHKSAKFIEELQNTDRDLRRIDKDMSTLSHEIDKSSNRVTLGLLAGALFIAATMLMGFNKYMLLGVPALSLVGYIIALFITFWLMISMLREKSI